MNRLLYLILLLLIISCNSQEVQNSKSELNNNPLTAETQNLYNNLKELAKTNILFGHQDAVAYGIGWKGGNFNSDVYMVSGDYPAFYGWDIGHIDSIMNLDSVLFIEMKRWIREVYNRGGINTIGWHGINLASGGSSWDTSRVVNHILPGGKLNKEFNAQLDNVAEFFNECITEEGGKIPIIFRPFHEHNGSWFWWGNESCSNEEYKKLWIYTHNYLLKNKGVNNVLFSYSTDAFTGREDYLSRYPGDEYVDFLGWDDYKSIRTKDTRQVFLDRIAVINELAKEKNKVGCLSETGYETLSKSDWFTQELLGGLKAAPATDHIAYLLVWRNAWKSHHYAPYPGHPSANDFITFKQDSMIMFLSDLPNMYNDQINIKKQ